LYFQEINVTGKWADAKHTGSVHFQAQGVHGEHSSWEAFGKVELKVAHGRTNKGTQYLNLYVRHLGRTGFSVGGLLGEDDHKEAATVPQSCLRHVSLIQTGDERASFVSVSVAEASFE